MEMSNETKERLLTVFTEMETGLQEIHDLSGKIDLNDVETHIEDARSYADDAESAADRAKDAASDANDKIEEVNETIRALQMTIKDVQIHANTVMDIVRPFLPKSDYEILKEFVEANTSTIKGLYIDNYSGEGRVSGTTTAIKILSQLLGGATIDPDEMSLSNEQIDDIVNYILQ
jgi:chromosome segregation ATPase